MILNSISKYSKNMMKLYIDKSSNVIDATCGNGIDTEFLASKVPNGLVYSFDIQKQAIDNAKIRCKNYNNVKFILDSHTNVHQYISTSVSLAIFNLGYYPGGDLSITTKSTTTITAIDNIIPLLNINGAIIINVYTGHDNHQEENDLLHYLKGFDKNKYLINHYNMINLKNSPSVLIIEKKY